MRRILLAFDGTGYSESPLEFAYYLHQKNPVSLVGAFLPQTSPANLWSFANGGSTIAHGGIPLLEEETQEIIQKNIQQFEHFCRAHGMEFRTHRNYFDFAVPELKKESRFADLLIICSESFFEQVGNESNDYLKTTLHEVECPVLIVPEKFSVPNNNVVAYDGGASSVHAIKQFSYLLPELAENQTTLLYAKHDTLEPLPEEGNVEEWMSTHFSNFSVFHFGPEPKKFFATWIEDRRDTILVCGAYGGSGTHLLFHRSFAADVVSNHKTPVFIAHR